MEAASTPASKPWLAQYPAGVPFEVNPDQLPTVVALMEQGFAQFAKRSAYVGMGTAFSFAEWDQRSTALAAWLQARGLQRGDRVALMLPNVLAYPVAMAAVLRAGCILVNLNPYASARELEHQLQDSGAKAIVVLETAAARLQQVIANTAVQTVLVSAMSDLQPFMKGVLLNHMLRRVKRLVPAYSLPGHAYLAQTLSKALTEGARLRFTPVALQPDDVALLQYTGGTTGLSKGAVLLHRNLIAKVLASEAWNQPGLQKKPVSGPLNIVCALPLHHVFAFVSCALLGLRMGARNLLIANPRDLNLSIKALQPYKLHIVPAVNTLFKGLLQHPDFGLLNFSELLISVGGGSPLQAAMAEEWQARTGCAIVQGYGLSETSSGVTSDRTDTDHFTGTVGLPIPGVHIRILSDDGLDLPPGEPGEVVIHGPQLMRGYWNQEAETRAAFTPDGGFRSGDIGVMDAQGHLKIVDRKKDMIIVSGFKVYPAEVEAVVSGHPGVLECAVVGVPDEKSGEAVQLFVVRRDPELSEEVLGRLCAEQLSAYKRPRQVWFVEALPKTPMGKLLRRELRVVAAAGNVSNGS